MLLDSRKNDGVVGNSDDDREDCENPEQSDSNSTTLNQAEKAASESALGKSRQQAEITVLDETHKSVIWGNQNSGKYKKKNNIYPNPKQGNNSWWTFVCTCLAWRS